ncbi:Mg-chelatase subunit ChlI [Thermoplasmatales archaeon BRNA1]|nr:Mg-chelatase subunit ChlI [Thermoplasmatales archaeon BRNA1]
MPQKDSLKPNSLPFSAIYGNVPAKTALMVAAVSPSIRAVMLKGASGTAKTVLARSIMSIDPGKKLINVPLNVTDEQLFGSIDLEHAVATGKVELGDCILLRANKNYLYLDDCDLFDPNLLTGLMDDVVDGTVRVERENVSTQYRVSTTVIASMHSSRKHFDSHVSDCFDICVTMRRPRKDDEENFPMSMEVLRRNLALEDDTLDIKKYRQMDKAVANQIKSARKLLPEVKIAQEKMRNISRICKLLGVKGCRGAISTAHTAKALAALAGRKRVTDDDVANAAVLCLDHRRTVSAEDLKEKKKNYTPIQTGEDRLGKLRKLTKNVDNHDKKPEVIELQPGAEGSGGVEVVQIGDGFMNDDEVKQVITKAAEKFEVLDIMEAEDSNGFRQGDEVAKRMYAESKDRNGKYVRARLPEGNCSDIAFDATIRAAAPYQRARKQPGEEGIKLEKQDLREKVREKQITSTFLFLLDTSGSLIIRNRMAKVKAAIESMLQTHYVKRDRVGLMTFNEEAIDLIMQPSRATEQLEQIIDKIAVGTGTPLSAALMKVYDYMLPYSIKHPDERCHIVLLTDGKATKALDFRKTPIEEALEISEHIDIPNADWIVIDTGLGYTKNDIPKTLAKNLHAKFFLLDDLQVPEDNTFNIWKGWSKENEKALASVKK